MTRMTPFRRAGVALLLAIALLTALTASATAQPKRAAAQMNVFAAASLTEAFPKFDGGQKYNFAGTRRARRADPPRRAGRRLRGRQPGRAAGALPRRGSSSSRSRSRPTSSCSRSRPPTRPSITSVYDLRAPRHQAHHRHADRADRRLHAPGARLSRPQGLRADERRQPGAERQRHLGEGRARDGRRRLHVRDGRAHGLRQGQADRRFPSGRSRRCGTRSRSSKSTKNHADAVAFIKRLTSTAGRKLLVDNGFGVPKLPPVKKPAKKK